MCGIQWTDGECNAEWCNGSTYDSDSYCLGSNPSSAANGPAYQKKRGLFRLPWSRGSRHRPLTAVTGVRIPLGVPREKDRLHAADPFHYLSLFYLFFMFSGMKSVRLASLCGVLQNNIFFLILIRFLPRYRLLPRPAPAE